MRVAETLAHGVDDARLRAAVLVNEIRNDADHGLYALVAFAL